MYWNRWIVFVAVCLLQASAGLNYSFSVFAPLLKHLFELNEVQLGAVATLGFNLGGYLALLSGLVYDWLGGRDHLGPKVVAITGGALLCIGYSGIYSLCTGAISFHYPLLIVFALLAGNAGVWFDTVGLATCLHNFPDDRGTIVGVLKAFVGLTATIYTAIYVAAFQPDTLHFILFLAIFPGSVAVMLSAFIHKLPLELHEVQDSKEEPLKEQQPQLAAKPQLQPCVSCTPVLTEVPSLNRMSTFQVPPLLTRSATFSYSQHSIVRSPTFQRPRALTRSVTIGHRAPDPTPHVPVEGLLKSPSLNCSYMQPRLPQLKDLGEKKSWKKHLRFAAVYSVVTAVALAGMTVTIVSTHRPLSVETKLGVLGLLVCLISLLVLVPVYTGPYLHPRQSAPPSAASPSAEDAAEAGGTIPLLRNQQRPGSPSSSDSAPSQTGLQETAALLRVGSGSPSDILEDAELDPLQNEEKGGAKQQEEEEKGLQALTTWQAMKTLSFWIIALQALVGVGTGLTFLNNVTGMVVAHGGMVGGQVAFVSMFSVSNATGRLFFGCASEQLLHTRGTRRPTFLVALSLMLAIFSGCMAIANIPAMYPLAVFGGVAFGGQWAVIPSVVADLFGITHFASTYAVIQIAPAAGNFLLGTMLVGTVYEAAKKHSATPDNRYCLGSACYATTWLIILGLNLVSLLGSVVLMLRSTVMYQRIHERVKQQSS